MPRPVTAVRELLTVSPREPKLEELVEAWIDLAGGPRAFAKELRVEYLKAPAGGQVRQRILAMMMLSLKWVNEKSSLNGSSFDDMSDVDLERELQRSLAFIHGLSEGAAQTQEGQRVCPPPEEGSGGQKAP